MNMKRNGHLFCLLALACTPESSAPNEYHVSTSDVAGCRAPAMSPGDFTKSILSDGRTRSYQLHVPRGYRSRISTPLVLAFHGAGGSAAPFERMADWKPKSDQEGFLLVEPEGIAGP